MRTEWKPILQTLGMPPPFSLDFRWRSVWLYLVPQMSPEEISQCLSISQRTVQWYIRKFESYRAESPQHFVAHLLRLCTIRLGPDRHKVVSPCLYTSCTPILHLHLRMRSHDRTTYLNTLRLRIARGPRPKGSDV